MDDKIFYEDIEEGAEHESSGRTVTEADVVNFAGLSADFNNMHIDEEFAKNTVFKTRVAHGMCVLSIATGLWFTMPRLATIAFMGLQDWRFSGAVKPESPFSTIKPRILPFNLAQTIAKSAIVPFVIHILAPLRM